MKNIHSKSQWLRALVVAGAFSWTSAQAQIQTAGNLFVNLDATTLTPGAINDVTNSGTLGGVFEVRASSGLSTNGTIALTNGIAAIQLSSTNCMQLLSAVGGSLIAPPPGLLGTNATTTIEVWALNPGVADDECMVSWGRRGFVGQNMAFGYGYNAGFGAVTHGTSPDSGWDNIGGAPQNGYWHHLAYTYNGTVQNVFVDGVLVNSKVGSVNIATNAGIMLGAQWTNNATAISTSPALASLFLARVRIHDGALTASQVLNNFNAEKAAFVPAPITPQFLSAMPVHRYSFDEPDTNDATGLAIHDSIGGADGIVRGTNTQSVAQFAGGRLVMLASETGTRPGPQMLSAYGDLPNGLVSANSIDNGGSGEVSIEVWYRNVGGVGSARVFELGSCGTIGSPGNEVFDIGGRPNGDVGLDWFDYTSSVGGNLNQRRLQWQNKDPLPGSSSTNATAISSDATMIGSHKTDRHVVVTWKESTGQVIAYENGIRVASIIVSNSMSSLNDVNVWLGRSVHTDAEFAGEFDEVRFYTNILSPGEVLGNFQVGADTINSSEQAATIIAQSGALTVQQSDFTSFYVLASGSPAVGYQWTRNGNAIPGATSNRYSLSSASLANNGDVYVCVISNVTSGVTNVVTTSPAALTVIPNQAPPAQFLHETRDGIRNNYSGTVGGLFQSGPVSVPVTHLGYYDMNKDGLATDHHVGIFDSLGVTLIASVTVPAGTGAYLTNGYRWAALNPPIFLEPNTTYILAAEVVSGDGDGWADTFAPGLWNPYFVGTNGPSTRVSRYGGAWPKFPTTSGSQNQAFAAGNIATLPIGEALAFIPENTVTQYSGLSISIPAIVNGQGPLSVQWYKSTGTPLDGQTNATLQIPAVTLSDAGDYYIVSSNSLGSTQSQIVTLTVLPGTPVTISTPPQDTTVPEGFGVTFSVIASGTPPFTYQWSLNGVPVNGATNDSFTIPVVSLGMNGNTFSCVVSNVADGVAYSATSSLATLTVAPNKATPMQVLHETRDGNRDDYSGNVGGNFLVGSTDALVTHLGYYDLDGDGLVQSHHVGIFTPGGTLLAEVLVPAGTDAYLTNGYRWVALNVPFVLTNNTSYYLGAEVVSSDGDGWPDVFAPTNWNSYFVGINDPSTRVSRYAGGAWPIAPSAGAGVNSRYAAGNLAVLPVGAPVLHLTSTNATKYVGNSVVVSAIINGAAPLTVQWFKAPGNLLPGQTNTTLVLSNLSTTDSGDYYLAGNNGEGSGTSESFHLSVLDLTAPIINEQPVSKTVYIHQRTAFSVTAVGEQPLSYQWKFNGADILAATNSALVILDADDARVGNYTVTVSNGRGSTNSLPASLSIEKLPEGSYAATVLDPSLLVYYRFGEVGGTNVALNLGNLGEANNGLYEFANRVDGPLPPAYVNFDPTNSAVEFDGLSSDVKIPAINFDASAPVSVTLAAWIYKYGPQTPYAGVIFSRGGDGANGFGVKKDTDGFNDVLEYHWNSANYGFASGLTVPDNQWVFVAVVVEPSRATLYLRDGNGLRAATNVAPHTAVAIADSSTYVGWDPIGPDARRFYGAIDEPMIFARALAGADLEAIYSAATAQPAPRLTLTVSGSNLILSWPSGTLQEADAVEGPYSDVSDPSNPYTTSPSAAKKFYRVKVQ